jgi:hypothetical protein
MGKKGAPLRLMPLLPADEEMEPVGFEPTSSITNDWRLQA